MSELTCRQGQPLHPVIVRAAALLLAIGSVAGAGLGSETAAAPPWLEGVRTARMQRAVNIVGELSELLALPNLASDGPAIRSNAEHLRDLLTTRGVKVEIWTLPGAAPVVFGTLDSPGARRTLGLYAHYDGQPVDGAKWSTPGPFEPTLYDGPVEQGGKPIPPPRSGQILDPEWRLYSRSASDDKAPIVAVLAALDALSEAGVRRTANLRFLLEGEEEAGSPHLAQYLERHRDTIEDVDGWLVCDGPVHQSRRPQLVFGVRGYAAIELTVYGPTRTLHSGHYGNWAPNPAEKLTRLLASLKDEDGRVLVEGFYDSTVPPGAAERAAIAALPEDERALRRDLGLAETEGGNRPLAERILHPSLNLRYLDGASSGGVPRNLIPSMATASLDLRLASGNRPDQMLDLVERHIRGRGYHVVREDPDRETRLRHPDLIKIERLPGYAAARTSMDDPFAQWVTRTTRSVAGPDLVLMPSLGGSLPLFVFTELLEDPLVVVPIANHDNNQHGPDENLRLANLWYGVDLFAALLAAD